MPTTTKNIGAVIITVLISVLFSVALFVWGMWSLNQTIAFSILASTPDIGVYIGIVIQFGQNFCIFMANKTSTQWEKAAWWTGWGVCAVLDAATNIGQYRHENAAQSDLLVRAVGYSFCIIVVFVEEMLAYSAAAALVAINDLLEIVAGVRFDGFDWAARTANRLKMRPSRTQSSQVPLPSMPMNPPSGMFGSSSPSPRHGSPNRPNRPPP